MSIIYFDCETVGLNGPVVLIQYAEDEGPIKLHHVWHWKIYETLNLIERIVHNQDGIVGFNLAFDWFQLAKIYNMFRLFPDKNAYPEDYIDEFATLEKEARDGLCIKPAKACDIMLVARKGPYQSTMARSDIRIKKVPLQLAQPLAQELEKRVKLKDIYFAKRKDRFAPKWRIAEPRDEDYEFRDIVLKFRASNALKALAVDALGIKDVILHGDISLPAKLYPKEYGWAPFALAVGKPGNWNDAWPDKIRFHIEHWLINEQAKRYASDDVKYTRELYKYFGSPELGDNDSELACLVAVARWKGYAVDLEKLKKLKEKNKKIIAKAPMAPNQVKKYVFDLLSPTEQIVSQGSTGKLILEEISKYLDDCPECIKEVNPNCDICKGKGTIKPLVAIRAQEVMDARKAKKEEEIYDKLILAERFHASFNVIGTLSSRMSGSNRLNPQAIKKTKTVRSCFPLAFPDEVLSCGDFTSFEVVIADAQYNDPDLHEALLSGKSPHGIFGTFFYDKTYEEIMKSKGTDDDLYTKAKSGFFALLYFAEPYTIRNRLGVTQERAELGYNKFITTFKKIGNERKRFADMFQALKQPNGIGSKVEWHEPHEYIESIFGFRRYFTLENSICKTLFQLAENPPSQWHKLKVKVTRRDREQSVTGAVRSALFASAFALQSGNTRAAGNHIIQSTGAQLTKNLQRRIWDLQPKGIHEWVVRPFNVHDELQVPTKPETVSKIQKTIDNFITEYKEKIPLLQIDWTSHAASWADK